MGKRRDGKLVVSGREKPQDLLRVNCRIIRQAPKRTWHLAPKGGACVQERFVGETYCRCQRALTQFRGPALSARRTERSPTPPNSPPWREIMGNYTFWACVINYYNHLLHTALLNIPPGIKGVNILLKYSVADCKISFQINRWRWRNAAENTQFIFTMHSRSLLQWHQRLCGFEFNSCIKRKLHTQ